MSMLLNIIPSLLTGCAQTLSLFAETIAVSLISALLLACLQYQGNAIFKRLLGVFIYIERGTPLMLQLMFIYFGLPFLGITLDRNASILTAFILNYTAYLTEIFRAGIMAVDIGQFEAARALGMSNGHMFIRIILPQAARCSIPPVTNEILNLIKDTSLITVLGASELLKAGRTAVNTYATALPFVYVGILYLIMSAAASYIMKKVENAYIWQN